MAQTKVTIKILRHVLAYDPETGIFTWKNPPSRRMHAGDVAGDVKSDGRRYISVCGESHLAHRLAWFYVKGEWPSGYVKHRNTQYDDNRFDNLFEATGSESNIERRAGKNNTSGQVGVSYNEHRNRWKAYIKRDWKLVHLGWYATREEAVQARMKAERELDEAPQTTELMNRIADHERVRQRQRTAYKIMSETYPDHLWASQVEFVADVGAPPGSRYTVVPDDGTRPIGPNNFKWFAPPSERFEMATAAGRAARKREVYRETNEAQKAYGLMSRYGITLEDRQAILEHQGGICAICGCPEDENHALWVDHDHGGDREVRGLLCPLCNSAIGLFRDQIKNFEAAVRYLIDPPARAVLQSRRNLGPAPKKASA